MYKEFYKKFQKLTHEETYKEVTKDMKDMKEIGDIGLHSKAEFHDDDEVVRVYHYRGTKCIATESFSYDEFVELFE